jgi:hypothetical protein
MYCSKCGNQIPDTSRFCNVCGQDIKNDSEMAGNIAPAIQPTHGNQGTVIVGNKQPDVVVAYLLWFFLGIFGVHHLYVGRGVGIWLLALITLQGFGLLWFADLFLIPQSCSKIRNSQTVILR